MNIPDNLYYTNDHEWIIIENGLATIGITDYAQSELGDIIFIEFPNIGSEFDVGDTLGTVEAIKTVADIYSPLKGRVAEINTDLENKPVFVNKDPYNSGWIIKLDSFEKPSSLLSSIQYKELIQ